jgi:hypothetical protein
MNLLKYLIPLVLLSCKAKIERDKIAIVNHKSVVCDSCEYRWQDNFTKEELKELNVK